MDFSSDPWFMVQMNFNFKFSAYLDTLVICVQVIRMYAWMSVKTAVSAKMDRAIVWKSIPVIFVKKKVPVIQVKQSVIS